MAFPLRPMLRSVNCPGDNAGRTQEAAMIDNRDYVGYGAEPPDPQWQSDKS